MRGTAALIGAGLFAAAPVAAQAPAAEPAKRVAAVRRTVAYFGVIQEQGPFTAEQMAQRGADAADDREGAAADVALNDWKLCVLDALAHWAELREGAGTLVDGAFGRCADIERDYRGHLQRITQDGRVIMDLQMARTMIRGLEETWRPRLIAAALDQMLAAQRGETASKPAPATP